MDPHFWHKRWHDNQIAFHQAEANTLLQQYWPRLGLKPGAAVFVPLCGKSRDMVWLASHGHRVLGIELSSIAVAAFFADHGLEPDRSSDGRFQRWTAAPYVLLCGDFFDLRGDDLLDVEAAYDRASLIAFPADSRRRYAAHLLTIVPADACVCLLTLEYDEKEMQGPPFSVTETEVRALFSAGRDVELLAAQDALARSQRFRDKGLTWMTEKIFLLRP